MRKRSYACILATIAATSGLVFATHAGAEPADAASPAAAPERYPTATIADYVIGCMLTNGPSQQTLQKCSCSLDYIAAALPYQDYEKAETLMRMQQGANGGRAAAFKGTAWANDAIARFKEVQAESTLRCF